MSRINTPEEQQLAKLRVNESSKRTKLKIKERIKISNYNESIGLPPDNWVVEYRKKNNDIKAKWKEKQPKKIDERKANSGSFKKGLVPKHSHTPEQRSESLIKWRENTKLWHKNNKERINELARKRRENPSVKIKCNLSKRLSFLLRKNIVSKTEQTFDLLGISLPEFMKYLEEKFTDGMTFENYGKWHLDHKKPCYYFDLTKEEDRKKCFHYTNIQPMWAIDNLKKNRHYVSHESQVVGQYHHAKDF